MKLKNKVKHIVYNCISNLFIYTIVNILNLERRNEDRIIDVKLKELDAKLIEMKDNQNFNYNNNNNNNNNNKSTLDMWELKMQRISLENEQRFREHEHLMKINERLIIKTQNLLIKQNDYNSRKSNSRKNKGKWNPRKRPVYDLSSPIKSNDCVDLTSSGLIERKLFSSGTNLIKHGNCEILKVESVEKTEKKEIKSEKPKMPGLIKDETTSLIIKQFDVWKFRNMRDPIDQITLINKYGTYLSMKYKKNKLLLRGLHILHSLQL